MNFNRQSAIIEGDKHMHTNRRAAAIVGVLFIFATVSAILGLLFYQPILAGPDYLINGAGHKNQVILGALMELILVCTAIGTAIGLFPVLRPYGERIALGHLCFRFLEAVVITIGIVAVLSLLTLSQDFVAAAAPDLPLITLRAPCYRSLYVDIDAWPPFLPGRQHADVQLSALQIQTRPPTAGRPGSYRSNTRSWLTPCS